MMSLFGHYLSMVKRSTDFHRWNVVHCFMSSETVKAIKLLSSGKAPESDVIPAEIYKAGGPPFAETDRVISHYVEKRSHPSRRDASIIHLFKRQGNPQGLWQSSGHLFNVSCWEVPFTRPIEPIEWIPWTVRASVRTPMWILGVNRIPTRYHFNEKMVAN